MTSSRSNDPDELPLFTGGPAPEITHEKLLEMAYAHGHAQGVKDERARLVAALQELGPDGFAADLRAGRL